MIGIFYDIIAYEKYYYVAEEIDVGGVRKFYILSGQHKNKAEAENILKKILKYKEDSKDGKTEDKKVRKRRNTSNVRN